MPQQYDAATRSYTQTGPAGGVNPLAGMDPLGPITGNRDRFGNVVPDVARSGVAWYDSNLGTWRDGSVSGQGGPVPGGLVSSFRETEGFTAADGTSTPDTYRWDWRLEHNPRGTQPFQWAADKEKAKVTAEREPQRQADESSKAQAQRWRALGGYVTRQANRGTVLTSPSGLPGSATYSGGGTQTMLGGDGGGL